MKAIVAAWLIVIAALLANDLAWASERDAAWINLMFKEASCGVSPNLPFYLKFPAGFESTDLGYGGCLWGREGDRALVKGKGQVIRPFWQRSRGAAGNRAIRSTSEP